MEVDPVFEQEPSTSSSSDATSDALPAQERFSQEPVIDFENHFGRLSLALRANYLTPEKSLNFIVEELSIFSDLVFEKFRKIVGHSKDLSKKTEDL